MRPLTRSNSLVAMDWDRDGQYLAVASSTSTAVLLWDANTRKLAAPVESGLKELSFLKWAKSGPHLVMANSKGNVAIFNKVTMRKVPVLGKHTRRVVSGAWNSENKFALVAEDKTVTDRLDFTQFVS
jgi:WD repeat-containing protein 19